MASSRRDCRRIATQTSRSFSRGINSGTPGRLASFCTTAPTVGVERANCGTSDRLCLAFRDEMNPELVVFDRQGVFVSTQGSESHGRTHRPVLQSIKWGKPS